MHFRGAFAVAALAAAPALAGSPSVNVYWGQTGGGSLAEACASNVFEYITLGFITASPENGGPTGYPGNNFAAHCWAEWYSFDGVMSQLLSECKTIQAGITPCQQAGKKVLLSIGGVYAPGYGVNYTISTAEKGIEFAYFLYGAFGPYQKTWAGMPRPFDDNDTTDVTIYNAVDGYDFDIETPLAGDEGYVAMIETLRDLIVIAGRNDIITGAPQCPLAAEWQPMTYLLQNAQFDRLFIQFYNNPDCQILDDQGQWNPDFNYAAWEQYLSTTPNKDAKLHIGLPADVGATGYVNATIANKVLCEYNDYPQFGGLMLWDQWLAIENTVDGVTYLDSIELSCGFATPTMISSSSTTVSTSTTSVATTSSVAITTTPTSSESSSTITSSTVPTSTSIPACGVKGYDSIGVDIGYYIDADLTTYDGCNSFCTANAYCQSFALGAITPAVCIIYDHPVEGYNNANPNSPYTFFDRGGTCPTASVRNTSSATSTSPSSTVSETILSSATFNSASLSSFSTSNSSYSTYSSTGLSNTTTSSYSSYSAFSSSESTTTRTFVPSTRISSTSSIPTLTSSASSWSNTSWTARSQSRSQSSISDSTSGSLTTSAPGDSTNTLFTTTVYTVTSCPPSVTDCPRKGHVTTETIPVGPTGGSSALSITASASVTSNASASWTTSTVYSTIVYTVTSCAASVADCPEKGHVTTETIAISTTVWPVTESLVASTAITSPVALSTSTIYSTSIYTVASCQSSFPNCPGKWSVTTVIVPVSTTVCPVTEGEAIATPEPVESTPATAESTVTAIVKPAESTGPSGPSQSPTTSTITAIVKPADSTPATTVSTVVVAVKPEGSVSTSSPSAGSTSFPSESSASVPSAASSVAAVSSQTSKTSTTKFDIFSTVTIITEPFPTDSAGDVPLINNAANTTVPVGTGYSVKSSSTPTSSSKGRGTITSSPVTAVAGRNSVAIGVPAITVLLALLF